MLTQALEQQGQTQDPQALYRAMRERQDAPPPEPEIVPEEPMIDLMENQVGVKPSASDRTLYVGAHRSMTMLDDLMSTANNFSKKQSQQADQPFHVALADIAPQDFARIYKEENI